MMREIGQFLSSKGLEISLILMLLFVLIDEKVRVRIQRKRIKILGLIAVFGYFALLLVDLTKIAIANIY